MSVKTDLIARRDAALPRGVARTHQTLTASAARGAVLIDESGREIIDFAGGIGVMNVGHCHPAVVKAIQEQAAKLTHTCIHVATYEPYVALCERLISLFPHGERTKAFLANTGAEAVENAVKTARMHTGRQGVLCFTESFHGRTLMALSLTSKVGYKLGCGPFAPEVYRLPYPNFWKYGDGLTEPQFVERELRRFRQALVNTVAAEQLACVLMEVVQGEGGFSVVPFDYLRGLRKLCDEHKILLILDEVQSGFCRTGKWAAYQHTGVTPDLSVWAKSMGGGMPISALLGRAEVMDAGKPGTLGGTFGGNPLSCAAALAAIGAMEKEDYNAKAQRIGRFVRERLERIRQKAPAAVGDVRGLGAMVAIELSLDGDRHKPATDLAAAVVKGALEKGALFITTGTAANVIRTLPPLVITDAQLERGLTILEEEIVSRAAGASAGANGTGAAARRTPAAVAR